MRKFIFVAVILFIGAVVLIVALYYGRNFFLKPLAGASKSEVKLVNDLPKLFVNGKELDTVFMNVYYIPDSSKTAGVDYPAYGSDQWVSKVKSRIDEAASSGVKAMLVSIWWGDLDKSTSRPDNVSQNFDFSNLDKVMDYAAQKRVYIIPVTIFYPQAPQWWLKENNFPPFNENGTCDICETDSYGNVYNNPSMNSGKVHQDFGAYLEAVINRYKNHPALLGWSIGVGATGEDNYGPNYISLMGMNGGKKVDRQPMMFTDYSPFFQRKFAEWMMDNKYKTDQALQKAWGNGMVSLKNLKVPDPKEMIKNGEQAATFPDPADGWWATDKNILTNRGLDFYEFRNYMRQKDRQFYSDLIRKNDPDHILLFAGGNEDMLDNPTLYDGITGNPNLSFSADTTSPMDKDYYYHIVSMVKNVVAQKKLAIITGEDALGGKNGGGELYQQTGKWESDGQLQYIEKMGEAIKCANGMFSYAVDLMDDNNLNKWVPSWFSKEAKEAAKKISAYQPAKNCDCSLAKDVYESNNCSTKPSSGTGCGLFDTAYHSFCNVPKGQESNNSGLLDNSQQGQGGNSTGNNNMTPPGNSQQSQDKCGDGVCDQIERQSSQCPQDCK